MKKRMALVLAVLILLCTACTGDMSVEDKTAESYLSEEQKEDVEGDSEELVGVTTQDLSSETAVNEPSWARGTQAEGELFLKYGKFYQSDRR